MGQIVSYLVTPVSLMLAGILGIILIQLFSDKPKKTWKSKHANSSLIPRYHLGKYWRTEPDDLFGVVRSDQGISSQTGKTIFETFQKAVQKV